MATSGNVYFTIYIACYSTAIYIILVGSIPLAMICERTKLATETTNIVINVLIQVSFVKYTRAMTIALYGDRCDLSHKKTFINYTVKDLLNNLVRLINGEYFDKNNKKIRMI